MNVSAERDHEENYERQKIDRQKYPCVFYLCLENYERQKIDILKIILAFSISAFGVSCETTLGMCLWDCACIVFVGLRLECVGGTWCGLVFGTALERLLCLDCVGGTAFGMFSRDSVWSVLVGLRLECVRGTAVRSECIAGRRMVGLCSWGCVWSVLVELS